MKPERLRELEEIIEGIHADIHEISEEHPEADLTDLIARVSKIDVMLVAWAVELDQPDEPIAHFQNFPPR